MNQRKVDENLNKDEANECKTSFIKMMQEPEPNLVYPSRMKSNSKSNDEYEINKINNENENEENQFSNEINEYTDTLTTWVYKWINAMLLKNYKYLSQLI